MLLKNRVAASELETLVPMVPLMEGSGAMSGSWDPKVESSIPQSEHPDLQFEKSHLNLRERILDGEELQSLTLEEESLQGVEGNPIGSLCRNVQAWKALGCSPLVISWIEDGIPLIFDGDPAPGGGRPNYVPPQALPFANGEITRLWVVKAVELDDGVGPGYIIPLGAVPKDRRPDKWRMTVDATDRGQGPNAAMPDKPFKMEHLDDLLPQIGKDWWALTFDLRAGFHHLFVKPEFRKWLRFRWAGVLFHFNVMPFGPRHSPYFFNKIVKEFVKILRRGCVIRGCSHQSCRFRASPFGVVIAPFVDDFCLAAATALLLLRIRDEIVVPLMKEMGFIRALGKGCWEPRQMFDFIGFTIDTVGGMVFIPQTKLERYMKNLHLLLSKRQVFVRELASVAGQIVSAMRAFAPALIYLRQTFSLISKFVDGATGWSNIVILTEEVRADLIWLRDHLKSRNGRFAWRPAQLLVLATDASSTVGWGATLKVGSQSLRAQGSWSRQQKEDLDIYMLEMMAILNSVQSFRRQLEGRRLQILTDNLICKFALPNGSRVPQLLRLVKEVQDQVTALDATIVDVLWIPSELNVVPDYLSRFTDTNDWTVRDSVWKQILLMWSDMAVDRFASPENARLPRFNTRFAHPSTPNYNCMAQNWAIEGLSYACPPMGMVPDVLELVREQRARAILVVPLWPQQPWWPLLQRLTVKSIPLGNGEDAFQAGPSGVCAPRKNPHWQFRAVEVNGKR